MRPRPHSSGFTIIELVVVLVIVGILAGLLIPAVQRASRQGQSTKCQSNMRQILIGLTLYEQDNNAFPALVNTGGDLITALEDYLGNHDVFHCPAHQDRGPEEYARADGKKTCYKYNDANFFHNKPIDNPAIHPGSLVLLIDTMDWEPRHFGGANLGFADGHARWYRKADYDGPGPFNPDNSPWYNWGKN